MSDLSGTEPDPPTTGYVTPLISGDFDDRGLTAMRHRVANCAEAAGLMARSLQNFVLAVNELTTNAVLHGGGRGWLRMWRAGGTLVCEVSDQGPGLPPERMRAATLPPAGSPNGRGLWLARRLFPTVSVATGLGGTTVRLTAPLPGGAIDRRP